MNLLNEYLLKAQKEWEEECYIPLKEAFDKENYGKEKLSRAFSCGVSDHYVDTRKKIMIVGQEARGHDSHGGLDCWQKWAIDYLERQVYNEHKDTIGYNRSPFWRFFNKFKKNGYAPCWNNIDKARKYCFDDTKGWIEHKLSCDERYKARELLNEKIFDGKSLLQKEIEIAKPDIVVFAIGTEDSYLCSLRNAFELEKEWGEYDLSLTATSEGCCKDISNILHLDTPAYWTYHPNYLNFRKLFEDAVKKILSL